MKEGAFHAIFNKIEADILLLIYTFQKSEIGNESSYIKDTFSRKIPDINASFTPNNVDMQGWSLKFEQKMKTFQLKYWNMMQEKTQVDKT